MCKPLTVIVGLAILLTGCPRIEIESIRSAEFCRQAENAKIVQGGSGFRDVIRVNTSDGFTIGYMNNGILIPHSECSAAQVTYSTTGTSYVWYHYGQPVESRGVHSIRFYTNSQGQLATETTRLAIQGRWQQQNVEGGRITRQIWLNEAPFDSIVVVDRFNGQTQRQSIVSIGQPATKTKTKVYNANNAVFDCLWNDGTVTSDPGCTNEVAIDINIIGVPVDSDFYDDYLHNAAISYPTSESKLQDEINRYW